jgi:hypothetical protein
METEIAGICCSVIDLVDTLRSCGRNGLSVREPNSQNEYGEHAQAVAQ